jgi:hypothetical protein
MHVFDGIPLGDDTGAPELGVEIVDVEGEDLLGPGGRLI